MIGITSTFVCISIAPFCENCYAEVSNLVLKINEKGKRKRLRVESSRLIVKAGLFADDAETEAFMTVIWHFFTASGDA